MRGALFRSTRARAGHLAANWRHGLQLAAAVVVSYLISATLGLHESLWAVMSSLIVMRPTTGSTMGAGWERMQGTLAGTLFGLGGIWLHQFGIATPLATLGIVALLALSSAWFPSMRSAPITALIVLSSADVAGQPALKVAGLRVAEIAIGVMTGLAISMLGRASRARARFDTACAETLRYIAADVLRNFDMVPTTSQEKEDSSSALRLKLRELALLAVGADRDARLWRRKPARRQADREACARTARLLVRISHDAAIFARLAESGPLASHDAAWRTLAVCVTQALEASANGLETHAAPDFGSLRRFCSLAGLDDTAHASPGMRSTIAWVAPSARLLLRDLMGLSCKQLSETDQVLQPSTS